MTTTDTDALTERLWDAITEIRDDFPRSHRDAPTTLLISDAVLPIVAEEVRKAKAEALREMQEHHEREADKAETITARGIHLTIADGARKRADGYEAGGSNEHR